MSESEVLERLIVPHVKEKPENNHEIKKLTLYLMLLFVGSGYYLVCIVLLDCISVYELKISF